MTIRRTLLFIPGNNPGMMMNAPIMGADTIILDLEDAVSPGDKDIARLLVRNIIRDFSFTSSELAFRMNDVTTPYWKDDLDIVIPSKPGMVVVPKVESPDDLKLVDEYILNIEKANGIEPYSVKFSPILETALGIENAFEISKVCKERLVTLFMGGEDLAASLNAIRTKTSEEIDYARKRVVVAARASGVGAIDTVYPDVEDLEGLEADTRLVRQLGYSGRAVISPRHIDIVNEIFSPSEKDIRYAEEVMEVIEEAKRMGKGAISLHGKMIDAPVVERARQILEMAAQINGGE